MNLFLYRVQYIFHLAKTMDRVPDILPYEYGGLWWDNISFVLEPRLFFPDKPRYEATRKTTKYTGIQYAGFKQGFSSFQPGLFCRFLHRLRLFWHADTTGHPDCLVRRLHLSSVSTISEKNKYPLSVRLSSISFYTSLSPFESDGLFLFGRLLLMFLVFYILGITVLPVLQRWLYKAG